MHSLVEFIVEYISVIARVLFYLYKFYIYIKDIIFLLLCIVTLMY